MNQTFYVILLSIIFILLITIIIYIFLFNNYSRIITSYNYGKKSYQFPFGKNINPCRCIKQKNKNICGYFNRKGIISECNNGKYGCKYDCNKIDEEK